jgi:eukaryotic-like serine/threonine-protein kinase
VPDAVGEELADAARAFGDTGLKVAVVYVPSREVAGRVVAQAQPAGTELESGDTVQLNVSIGAEPAPDVEVPDVAEKEQADARRQLGASQFEVLTLRQRTTDRSRAGFVLSQSPAGGASIPRGSLVLLYVGE